MVPLVRLLPCTYPHPRFRFPPFLPFPLSVIFFPPEIPPPPWECDHSHSVLCCIAFARGHRKTAEHLCRRSRLFHRVCPRSTVFEKMTFRSAFRYAGRGLAVTHPSTDQVPSYLSWVTAWCRTPTTHLTLSVLWNLVYDANEIIYFIYSSFS